MSEAATGKTKGVEQGEAAANTLGSPAAAPSSNGSPATDVSADLAPAEATSRPMAAGAIVAKRKRHLRLSTSIQSLLITIVCAVFIVTFLEQPFQIPSSSMENTLLVGDYLLVDKVHYAQGGVWGHLLPYEPIHRGDIVVFHFPIHPEQHFVKRVIGLPGD